MASLISETGSSCHTPPSCHTNPILSLNSLFLSQYNPASIHFPISCHLLPVTLLLPATALPLPPCHTTHILLITHCSCHAGTLPPSDTFLLPFPLLLPVSLLLPFTLPLLSHYPICFFSPQITTDIRSFLSQITILPSVPSCHRSPLSSVPSCHPFLLVTDPTANPAPVAHPTSSLYSNNS